MKQSSPLFKYFLLPGIISRALINIHKQRTFLHKHIHKILQDALQKNDGSLDLKDLEKINRYYGLAVPAILGEAFCALRGSKMTEKERWASTCQGAMTGLFDDFFDKDYLSDEAVENMIQEGGEPVLKKNNQQLFDLFYKKALLHSADNTLMQHALIDVYTAQVKSKEQKNEKVSGKSLLEITNLKGGSSLIFYRTAFSPAATASENKLLYDLGGLMQLANDIFDIFKDRESGIKTLITETNSIDKIKDDFEKRIKEYYSDAFNCGYHEKNVRKFINSISIGIFSRCFVCLDQLKKNEMFTGNVFDVHKYNRKQLICDMDKIKNMLKSASFHIRYVP